MARNDKAEVSLLAVEMGSLFNEWNMRELEERVLFPPFKLFMPFIKSVFFPLYTNSLMYKMAFLNVQFKNTKHCLHSHNSSQRLKKTSS